MAKPQQSTRTGLADRAGAMPTASYHPLVVVVAVIALGMAADRFLLTSTVTSARLGGIWSHNTRLWTLSACFLVGWLKLWVGGRHGVSSVCLLLSVAATGATWHHHAWNVFDRTELSRFAVEGGEPVCLLAVARSRPQRMPAPPSSVFRAIPRGERSRLPVDVLAIRDGTAWADAAGRCALLVEGHLLGVRTGDRLRIFGRLRRTSPAMNPGDLDFSLTARAERQLAGVIAPSPDCVSVTFSEDRWRFARFIDAIRQRCERLIWQHVDARRAGLASAMLLGRREALTHEQTTEYMLTGTIHLLVVSGLHVGIVVAGLYLAMRWGMIPRRLALVAIVMLVVCYAVLVGARPPVIRAAVLTILMCLAAGTGKRVLSLNSLAAAGIVVLALNPADLFQIGPQLSFLAVVTLIWIGEWILHRKKNSSLDPIQRLVEHSRPWHTRILLGAMRTNGWLLLATTAVWLTALPLVMLRFHVLAPVAIVISPVIWPLVSLALFSGFGMLICGWLLPPLAGLCGDVCDMALGGLSWLVRFASDLPLAHWWVPGPAGWWVAGFYAALLFAPALGRKIIPRRWQVGLLCGWILVGVVPTLAGGSKEGCFRCTFLAVGHGASVVMRAPGGETLLYDAGSLSSPEFAAQSVSHYLWHLGVRRIDGIVLSHADVDHFNAVPALLQRFDIGTVFVSPMMFDGFGDSAGDSSAPTQLKKLLEDHEIPIREITGGDRLRFGDAVSVEVLHPPRLGMFASDNADSVTLAVEYGDSRVMLPGDLESPGLEAVLADMPYDCDVLLAPHHGSRRSNPPGFAAWCNPEWVVISGGGGDRVERVTQTYQASGAVVMRTDRHGAIQVNVDRIKQISVKSTRP